MGSSFWGFFSLVFLCVCLGGGVAAGPAGAAQERGRAERCNVPRLVTGNGESEKQAGYSLCSLSVPGNAGCGRVTLLRCYLSRCSN